MPDNSIKVNIFHHKYKILMYEKLYFFILLLLIGISCFITIPSDTTPIGISSDILGIGDRSFYINDSVKGFGYAKYSGNVFYPYILKFVSYISNLFGENEYSKLWNSLTISFTSITSIISLRFLRLSSQFLFNERVSKIACLIYILNPYTYFYSLSGGITNYLILGTSSIIFLVSNAYNKGYKFSTSSNTKEIFLVSILCGYLSGLRPTGGIFGGLILIILLSKSLKNLIHNNKSSLVNFINLLLISIGLIFVTYNLYSVYSYIFDNVRLFSFEQGYYFGYSRDLLRSKLNLPNANFIDNFKSFIYFTLWKSTEFVSGLSDIRDTHSAQSISNILPFLIRTFTGIFILFPLNLFSFLGLLFNIKFIIKSESWIFILPAFIALSPSILGVAMSRYLIMIYCPFIIFAAKMISDTIEGVKLANNN